MLEKCPECNSLGGHTYNCTRVGLSIRAADEEIATQRIAHIIEAWPRGVPRLWLPTPPSLAVFRQHLLHV